MDVPSGFTFQLDSLISRRKFLLNLGHQPLNVRLDTQRDAARNNIAYASDQTSQRNPVHLRLQIPNRIFQRSLCHTMAANPSENLRALSGMRHIGSGQRRRQLSYDYRPGRIHRFVAEVWMLAGGAFTPSDQTVGSNLCEQNTAICGAAKACLERFD